MPPKQRQLKIEQRGGLAAMQELDSRSDEELLRETRHRAAAQAILGARAADRYDAPAARAHFQKAIAAARPQERMQLRRMAQASLALAERRAGDLKEAVERLGQEAPSGRQLLALRVMGLLAPPPGASLAVRARGFALLFAIVVPFASPADSAFAGDMDVADGLVELRDDATNAFVGRLLDEINTRRDALGTPRLTFVAHGANEALDQFLSYVAPSMEYPNPCMHQTVGDALAWDYVAGTGVGASPLGEVLACPGPDPKGYWTPSRTAESWWTSPMHADILYGDFEATGIACGAYAPKKSGRSLAAAAVLCVTYRD